MNRAKQYDREKLLAAITDIFMEKGFEATSINEIVTRTKINKFSIYNEFGNKEKLYLASLDYCDSVNCSYVKESLTREPLGLSNIEDFFLKRIRFSVAQKGKECVFFNSIFEKNFLNKKIDQRINKFIVELNTLLCKCLESAQKRREISDNKDCKELANYFTCLTLGLVSIGTRRTNEEELRRMVKTALTIVKD